MKTLIVLATLVLSSTFIIPPCEGESQNDTTTGNSGKAKKTLPWVGNYAPDFTLKTPEGQKISLSDYRGKVVFLNFWAIWCGPCLLELPVLDKLNKEMKSEDFVVVAVNLDQKMGEGKVKDFLKSKKFSFTVLLDQNYAIGNEYYVRGIPINFIIDRDGVIVKRVQGLYDWNHPSMKEEIIKIIEKPHKKSKGDEAKIP